MKTINLNGTEYSTMSHLVEYFDFANSTAVIRHLESHGVDSEDYRIKVNLKKNQRLALGLNTNSSTTVLYEASLSEVLKKPKPLKNWCPSIEPIPNYEFIPRRFLKVS